MKVCIVGPGRIGSNIGQRCAQAGHTVVATFATDAAVADQQLRLLGIAFDADGIRATSGADVIVLSVPWNAVDAAWASIGARSDAVLVDTTNPFGEDGLVALPETSAAFNAKRLGVRSYAKAFNTLTAAFQHAAFDRSPQHRAAMLYAASDKRASDVAQALITAVGFVPISVGPPERSTVMEAPRRPGAAYGEELSPSGARALVAALPT